MFASMVTVISIKDLKRVWPLIKLSALARHAHLNENTLDAKVRTARELTVTEARAIEKVLESFGLTLKAFDDDDTQHSERQ